MKTVLEYSVTGTLHGIRYIFESGRNLSASKMIWTVFVFCAASAGIVLSIQVQADTVGWRGGFAETICVSSPTCLGSRAAALHCGSPLSYSWK